VRRERKQGVGERGALADGEVFERADRLRDVLAHQADEAERRIVQQFEFGLKIPVQGTKTDAAKHRADLHECHAGEDGLDRVGEADRDRPERRARGGDGPDREVRPLPAVLPLGVEGAVLRALGNLPKHRLVVRHDRADELLRFEVVGRRPPLPGTSKSSPPR
jgi:hypothetical protein